MTFLPKRFREPVIADRTVDVMSAFVWFCLAGWGVTSVIFGLGTILDATSQLYLDLWGGAIGILAIIAFVAAVSTFFPSRRVQTRINRKVVELVSVSIMAGFISLYPIFMLQASVGGDLGRWAPFWASLTYLAIPTWRVRHLFIRIKKLREVARGNVVVTVVAS